MTLPRAFKDALASWASGVTVVTAERDGEVHGITASAFTSLSLDPPLVLVCLGHETRVAAAIREGGRFAVSVLARDQQSLSEAFASRGRSAVTRWEAPLGERTPGGLPVLAGAAAWLGCDLHEALAQGDHTVFIGRVDEAAGRVDRAPLVYFRRRYRGLDDPAAPDGSG